MDSSSSSDVILGSGDYACSDDVVFVNNLVASESMLSLDASAVTSSAQHKQTDNSDSRSDSPGFDYYTPPSSPEPVYIFEGIPSKDDEELTAALSLVSFLRNKYVKIHYE